MEPNNTNMQSFNKENNLKTPYATERPSPETLERGQILDDRAKYGETQRGLKPRHVQLMAIGGSIGTGLFVGIGGRLSSSGPLSLVLGYLFYGILFIWPLNLCVAEMVSYLPMRGTVFELTSRFVDPALSFSMGWTYFYSTATLVCVEYAAVAAVMGYWSDINPAAWVAIAMTVCIVLNVVAVKWYGESEFVMASFKILLLVGLIMITIVTMSGGNPHNDAYGFRHWGNGELMKEYYTTGSTGKFLGFWQVSHLLEPIQLLMIALRIVVRYAAFTTAGPDILVLAAGEIQNPRRTIPRVAKLIFYRIVGFYVIGALAVGIICSSQDPRLLGAISDGSAGAAASPWVIGIQNLGITGLPHLINFLILLSGLSCGNAYLYAASRTLYSLARDRHAPKIFMTCTATGIPLYCVGAVSLISCLTFLVASNSAATVFWWFVDLCTTGLVLTYLYFFITFLCWYRARTVQNLSKESLHYTAPWTPYCAYLALTIGTLVVVFIGFDSFAPFSVQGFVTSYFAVPYSAALFLFWKVYKKTKFQNPSMADLYSGKAEIDEECRRWEEGGIEENEKRRLAEMTVAGRLWQRLW